MWISTFPGCWYHAASLKDKRNQSLPVFGIVLKLGEVPTAGSKRRRKRNQTIILLVCSDVFAGERRARAPSLVVGHGPAGQDHQGEDGEGQGLNGLAGQSEARPLGYLSQEVGPGHILKHSACGWKKSSTFVNKQIRLK